MAAARGLRSLSNAARSLAHPDAHALATRPTYYTCRHAFESTLIRELGHGGVSAAACSVPCSGLVQVRAGEIHQLLDPAYALQALPAAVEVQGESIARLAHGTLGAMGLVADEALVRELRKAPRGSLAVHAIVPAMLKGTPKPHQLRRCQLIADKVTAELRRMLPCARGAAAGPQAPLGERWLLQLLLLEPERLIASLSVCARIEHVGGRWPCWHHPAGLAQVDIAKADTSVPSSAYRKLHEAFACMGAAPRAGQRVVDLGACPGGWTRALRRLGCGVLAVDKSPLAPGLMEDAGVAFVGGDAFAVTPPFAFGGGATAGAADWMVSDLVVFPERVAELLERWCAGGWAARMVVTLKFQDEPCWQATAAATRVAEAHGFAWRLKHFFNNKRELTLMLRATDMATDRDAPTSYHSKSRHHSSAV